jgi:hypothetical protein
MQKVFAIALLTWKAAFRFRLFLVVAVLLLAAVVGLPLLIEDDGTARGFTQILLTYTLTTITALLGMSTLWLACGTLARDIEECQIQVVAVKPIARWQIWLGKWLGLISLNAALLSLSGICVFALMHIRAGRLPEAQQQILRNEVLVARGSAREASQDAEIAAETDRLLRERLERSPVVQADLPEVRRQILEQVKAEYQLVQPRYVRQWDIDLSSARRSVQGQPLFVRLKFNSAEKSPSGTFAVMMQAGSPPKPPWRSEPLSLAPDTFHEIEIPADLIGEDGKLAIAVLNPNDTSLLFSLEEGLEVLYREGSFGLNFARGLGIIFCWMTLLATIGLASASFLSFPVAAFFSLGLLAITLSSGTIANAVSEGTLMGYNSETNQRGYSVMDHVAIPVFRVILGIVNLAKDFSPVDSLSTGRSITWGTLLRAAGQIIGVLCGLIGGVGIWIFQRRELATAQGTQ